MKLRPLLIVVLLPACGTDAAGGSRTIFEVPEKASLRFSDTYLRLDAEMDHQVQETDAGGSLTRQRFLFQPALGVGFAGWVYHPNLFEYVGNAELGWDYQNSSEDPGVQGDDSRFLQRYHLSLDFLRQKPYALNVYADRDMIYRDYDFFSRVRVDSQRCGGRTGYSAGLVPFTVGFQHYEETIQDITRPTELREDTLSFNATNQRRDSKANTTLNYNYDDYARKDDGFSQQTGLNQNVSLVDGELFGDDDWLRLSTLLNYNSITETISPTEKLLVQENLRLQHTENFGSFYEYSFDHTTTGDSYADSHQGRVGVTHQLYENLSSTVDAHGITTSSGSPGSYLDTKRYGAGVNEQYNRRLGSWGNISLGYSGAVDREEREASGQFITIIDELHTLSDSTLTFLDQPLVVLSSIVVTDGTGTLLFVRDLDYLVTRRGQLTEIKRIPGGRISNGSVVLVDYTAVLDPSGKYTSYNNSVSFRIDFQNGVFALYGHWTTLDFSGGEQLNLRWLDDKVIGVDSNWRWFRTGAEYEVMDSNLSPFDRFRLFQSASFRLSESASLGFDADESWTRYREDDTDQTGYGFIARYQQRLSPYLAWNVEGGVRIERGQTFDRDYGTVRTELDWAIGKLTLKAGYEFGSEGYPNSLTQRNYAYLRVRRSF